MSVISSRRFPVRIWAGDCDPSLTLVFKASTLSIFKPGSTSPSATLYDAWENFSKRSPKADESIRSIRPDLATAVDECIDAAGQEWEPKWQRRLLNVRPATQLSFNYRAVTLFRLQSLDAHSWICTTRTTL